MNRTARKVALLFALLTQSVITVRADDWWSMPDDAFAKEYAKSATSGDPAEQSRIAWMLFARVNQPQQYQKMKVTQWELWPSDPDTFQQQQAKSFRLAGKVRTQPHLQVSKLNRMAGLKKVHGAPNINPAGNVSAGEEVTRNLLSYKYIKGNGLDTAAGVTAFLKSGQQAQFPIGVVEVKATWASGAVDGAYTFTSPHDDTVYSLTGLHIMGKFVPTPKDAFNSPEASWFWTTFEFKGNPGLKNAQSLLLPSKDALPPADALKLLAESGVSGAFANLANYVCNGTQISFVDAKGSAVLLGNTQMETFGFMPGDAQSPAEWKSWKISCHTCHGEASAILDDQGKLTMQSFGPFKTSQQNVGPIQPAEVKGYTPLDFNWAIPFHAK